MELEGFSASLQGSSIVVMVEKEEEAWIPWEFLSEGMTILICGKEVPSHRIVRDSYPWNIVWTPTTSRDWSMIATILKATAGPLTLVIDLGGPIPPFAFTEFLDSRPLLTKLQIAKKGTIAAFGGPRAVIWSSEIPLATRMEFLRSVQCKETEAAVVAAVTAATDSHVQVMACDQGGGWKLYWIRPDDSWSLVKGLGDMAKCSLRTGMQLLEL
jgi:hypothetical protein